jgi:glyoxalase superfamily protein
MHRSKLRGFIIDCEGSDLAAAAGFWGEALGMRSRRLPEDARYIELLDPSDNLHIEVQAVTHPSRVHLDIETDDIDAEVGRLEALGARRIAQVRTWWVMEAPTGQRFCIVARASADFDERASIWP